MVLCCFFWIVGLKVWLSNRRFNIFFVVIRCKIVDIIEEVFRIKWLELIYIKYYSKFVINLCREWKRERERERGYWRDISYCDILLS